MARRKSNRLRFNAWTLGGHGAEIFEKSPEALELERMNPLRGVDEWRLGQIFDDARDGVYADLAWLYNEIEGVEPALAACCDMRESAASECGWLVKTVDADRARGFDAQLAEEQRVALLAEFGAAEDDLAELAGHLAGAFFRGAAHAQPLWNEDGSLAGFRHLDLWNMALDKDTGIWYWNADASRDENTFQPIPPGELVTLASTRHADHAALPIFIRAALGAKRYGVWLDRFGIPPVGVIMPPNAEKGEQGAYMDLARKFARGGSGILPNGSSVVYGTEARAVCPFIDFIRFQQQQIYLVGIGRVQSGETDGANLGGNAAGVVEDGFRRLVRRDARRIARAINDCVTRKVLARLFPGKPALAQFAWDTEAKRTAHEVLEDAGLAKSAGLAIDIDQMQEMTGYKLGQAAIQGPGDTGMSLEQLSSLIYPLKAAGYTIQKQQLEQATKLKLDEVQTDQSSPTPQLNSRKDSPSAPEPLANRLQNAPGNSDAQGEVETAEAILGPFLSALKNDCKPLADAVEKLIADGCTPDAAKNLLAHIGDYLPADPAAAAVLAEDTARTFAEAFTSAQKSQPSRESQEATNAGTSEGAKKGWETRRRNGWTPEQLAANKATVDSLIADLSRRGPNNSKAWKNEPKDLGEVSQALADEIHAANPDMKVNAGTMQTIDQDQLNHALEEHGVGKETRPNQIPITEEDLKRIPDVLADYDDIRRGLGKADGKQQEGVIFCKKYDDGTVCCVEIDWFRRKDNRRELKFQTMWKEKPEEGAKNE